MPPDRDDDDLGSLERARERLYEAHPTPEPRRTPLSAARRLLPHAWASARMPLAAPTLRASKKHVRWAAFFLFGAIVFFLLALAVSAYLIYYGGNSISVNNVSVQVVGPTSIAGGDTVPLALAITNRNPVAIENATIEIDFPSGTRSASDVMNDYPSYTENLGTIPSGATVTRSVSAVIFGAAGQAISLPVSFSFGTAGSNATFVKQSTYALSISSTPLSISVDTLSQTVSGQSLPITLTVRSNATVPLENVVVAAEYPFGYSLTSSSVPENGDSFLLGTLAPGASDTITLNGTLSGDPNEMLDFHFTAGTADAPDTNALALTYMTQDAEVAVAAPFIETQLAIDGSPINTAVLAGGTQQTVSLNYANTLDTAVENATVSVTLSGDVDFGSVQTADGFYQSSTNTITFSSDTDPGLASLAPGATGVGSFTFATLPASTTSGPPEVTFSVSVSGTEQGETNVPEAVTASEVETADVATSIVLAASTLHAAGPFVNSGPVPPVVGQPTTYTIHLAAENPGSDVAGGTVTATLPSYVTYLNASDSAITYDSDSSTVTWDVGDLPQGSSAQDNFQVSFTPSSSQAGSVVALTNGVSFSGHDRFANVTVTAAAPSPATEMPQDAGYVPGDGVVQ